METDLNQWVIENLNTRKWSMRKLGQLIQVHHSTISRILSGKQTAKLDFYFACANAFNAIPDFLQMAGLLPAGADVQHLSFSQLLETVKKLPTKEQQEVLDYAQYRLWKQQQEQGPD